MEVMERDDERWTLVFELATTAARRCQRRFGRWAAFDDMVQVAMEYAWRKRELVSSFLEREDEKERKRGEWALVRTLERACERYARQEKAAKVGYKIQDEYFYDEATVEALVCAYVSGDTPGLNQVLDPAEMGGRRKSRPASEGNDLLAMVADAAKALGKLDPRTYGIVVARATDSQTVQQLADAWEISHQRVSQIHRQGVLTIVRELGGERP
jgi:RNA polymerase sigma factor (sigma-70 family)